MSQRVLLVDDDETLLATLRYNLVKEGYLVSEARTGTQAIAQARNTRPDLIVLDLMLPEVNGLEVCRILRTETRIPILMLTAKDGELDKVIGLQIGADDYLTKPFSLLELMARISALLRRAQPRAAATPLDLDELEGFRLDHAARTVHVRGAELHLAPKEFDLLSTLLRNAGRVLTRDEILSEVWGSHFSGRHTTVDVHVRWLREKFERLAPLPFRISTVPRQGYRLDRLG